MTNKHSAAKRAKGKPYDTATDEKWRRPEQVREKSKCKKAMLFIAK